MENQRKTREIDFLSLVVTVLKDWKRLCVFIAVFAVIGIIVALSTPKYYKSEVILAPEMSSGGLGLTDNLADMAANFGFDIGGKSAMDAIYPELYPDIFNSPDFIMNLFDIPVRLKNDDTPRSYKDHITKEQSVPFWSYPSIWLSELLKPTSDNKKAQKDQYKISRLDHDICNAIRDAILCSIDKKTSVITISVTDQDPLVSTIVADTLQSRLQTYITEYRTSKARTDYEYYKKLTADAKADYEKARRVYGSYSDANMDVILESYKAKTEDLENDMQLKFNSYTAMNTQLQAAKAKIQERTPAFTVIQKPIMPYKASSTPRSVIVLFFMILGGICDTIWVLYGRQWFSTKKQ